MNPLDFLESVMSPNIPKAQRGHSKGENDFYTGCHA
jgi:hypothetical protein